MNFDDPTRSRLGALLGPLHEVARRTARRLARSTVEGDDLFQEAVLRAIERLGDLRDDDLFRPWFFRVLFSVHRNRARRDRWRRFLGLDGEAGPITAEPVGEDGGRWEEDRLRARRLAAALATLPAVQREAVVLFELEGLSLEEVAALQNSSLPAVKTRLCRARDRLRAHYRRLLDETARREAAALVAPTWERRS